MQPKRGLDRLVALTLAASLALTLARGARAATPVAAADTTRTPASGGARPSSAPSTGAPSTPSKTTAPTGSASDTAHAAAAAAVRELARAHAAAADTAHAAAAAAAPRVSPDDTTIGSGARVPGTRLRLGDGAGRARRGYALLPGNADEVAPGEVQLAGDIQYFGIPSKGKLVFDPSGLTRASFQVDHPSPNQRDYLEDQLTRSGYRRECQHRDDRARECDWIGAVLIHVKCDSALMTAEVVAAGAELSRSLQLPTAEDRARAAEEARLRPFLTDPTPILPDTLSLDPAAPPGPLAPPMLLKTAPPIYDDALAARGVKGIVQVLALVGPDGLVNYSRATDGPEELRGPAIHTVTQFRFSGYTYNGQKVRFWVWIPVRFGV